MTSTVRPDPDAHDMVTGRGKVQGMVAPVVGAD